MKFDPTQAYLTAESALSQITADPIRAFRFSSNAQRRFFQSFHDYREVYLRAGSNAGKTHVGAMFFVALMRGIHAVCGDIVGVSGTVERHPDVSLPMLGVPVSGVVLAQGREQAKDSVIAAILRAVGKHPHHLEKNGNNIAAIWVKPDRIRSDEWRDWSVVRLFVEDGQSVAGMRLDFAWADEPPKWDMWVELRMRGKANKPFLRGITATPIKKAEWKPLRTDYKECEDRPVGKNGKIELRLSVYDNRALGPAHIKQVEQDAVGEYQDAKLNGDYVDTSGQNPFDKAGLKRWKLRCVDPLRVQIYHTSGGHPLNVELWEEWDEREDYMVVADPSAGIKDEAGEHDPCEVIVVARRNPRVVARYNGYIPSFELGRLSRQLAEQYGTALLVWENNSGYGEAFFLGTRVRDERGNDREYGRIFMEYHENQKHLTTKTVLGWTTTAQTRGIIVSSLQQAIVEDALMLWSRDAVESLDNVVLKRDGIRAEAGAGCHDEDMIVLGLACHLCATYPPPALRLQSGSAALVKALGLRLKTPTPTDPFARL